MIMLYLKVWSSGMKGRAFICFIFCGCHVVADDVLFSPCMDLFGSPLATARGSKKGALKSHGYFVRMSFRFNLQPHKLLKFKTHPEASRSPHRVFRCLLQRGLQLFQLCLAVRQNTPPVLGASLKHKTAMG